MDKAGGSITDWRSAEQPAFVELLPSDEVVVASLTRFASSVQCHYGDRLVDVYLYGSRARGTHRPESDADVAVVLREDVTDYWAHVFALANLSYPELVDHGVEINARPVSLVEWDDPTRHANPSLGAAMKRDARRLPLPE